MVRWIVLAALWFGGSYAIACEFDSDCELGSRCARQPGSMSGSCAGGTLPAGPHQRGADPFDRGTHAASACSSDAECGFGGQCRKEDQKPIGTCVGGVGVGVNGVGVGIHGVH